MYKKPSRFGLYLGLLASLAGHAAAGVAIAILTAPPPKPPPPFALSALKSLAGGEALKLQESSRLLCASFPFACEEELFVSLELSEIKDDVDLKDEAIEALVKLPESIVEPPKPDALKEVPKIEVKPDEPKKPEEKLPEETMALVPTPPPPVIQPKERPKSVDQVVEKEDKVNPDPKFLAEQTHVVEEQTQAKVTSDHIMDKKAQAVSDPDVQEEEPEAGSEEKKVASVQENRAKPTENKSQVFQENKVEPVAAVVKPPGEKAEGKKGDKGDQSEEKLAVTDPNSPGDLPTANPKLEGDNGNNGRGETGTGKAGKNEPNAKKGQPRLTLTMNDFNQLYGETAEGKEGQEEASAFNKGGKSKREKFIMAQLENYLPEVKPGNQTALSTAADPFAKFLHQMHLRIHKKWGDGILHSWDSLGGSNALNNPGLLVTLEIVIGPDGKLEKAAPLGSSGYLPYDVAAVSAVYDSGPYPTPPESIRSYNGKVYLRWTLHRDNRQCATSFAEPYLLAGPKEQGQNQNAAPPKEPSANKSTSPSATDN